MKKIYVVWIQYVEDCFNIEFDSAFENRTDALERRKLIMEQKAKEGYVIDFEDTFDPIINDDCRVYIDEVELNKS